MKLYLTDDTFVNLQPPSESSGTKEMTSGEKKIHFLSSDV